MISKQSCDDLIRANHHLILSSNHHITIRISKIINNLAKNIHYFLPELNVKFQVFVVENPEPNAFVLPGGQIFVNTGLLSVARNDHGLATVLAHEVSIIIINSILFNIYRLHTNLLVMVQRSCQRSSFSPC